jgi:hypothetical protein
VDEVEEDIRVYVFTPRKLEKIYENSGNSKNLLRQ